VSPNGAQVWARALIGVDGAHPERSGCGDVAALIVDEHDTCWFEAEQIEGSSEDATVGLAHAGLRRVDDDVEQLVPRQQTGDHPGVLDHGVRDDTGAPAVPSQASHFVEQRIVQLDSRFEEPRPDRFDRESTLLRHQLDVTDRGGQRDLAAFGAVQGVVGVVRVVADEDGDDVVEAGTDITGKLLEIVDVDAGEHGTEIEHHTAHRLGVGIPAHSTSAATAAARTNIRCPPRRSNPALTVVARDRGRTPDSAESHTRAPHRVGQTGVETAPAQRHPTWMMTFAGRSGMIERWRDDLR
jgi:hypothetical protein